ncbi:MAG TPA: bifunctional lysylphosphatidylglycerol flippase/synthetase MprF [Vicinamibacterales bacterium]|nr:bifunctional lysylphosphatidylglycerol flippase/synthetase MprF [Vicinamibacterales bacterium]
MRTSVRAVLPAVIGLALFVGALVVLWHQLAEVTWAALSADVVATPRRALWQGLILTTLSYLTLTGYDFVAMLYIRKHLPRVRIGWVSFLAYAVANNVGFAALSGASIRYRFYTRWGLTAEDLSLIVLSNSVACWLGLLMLGGLSLVSSAPAVAALPLPAWVAPVGWACITVALAYVVVVAVWRDPVRVRGFLVPPPRMRLTIAQLAVSAIDWTLAAAVLYVLLPPSPATFVDVLGAFLLAQLLGMVSHVPGGIGVFEGLVVFALSPFLTAPQLVPALVVYRAVYYVVPLTVALVGLVIDEVLLRRAHAIRLAASIGRITERLTPQMLATFTFVAGVMLLFSGATPGEAERLHWLDRVLPLGVIEASHVTGSVAGAALLLLSQGLSRRLDAAYYLTIVTVTAGVVASLLKGFDYEEALLLVALVVILLMARPAFNRKAAFFATRFSTAWIAAVAAALVASVWLGLFAFKHVEYSQDLWWQFELEGNASRFLRGSVGAASVVLLFALARLIGHAPHEVEPPSEDDLETAGRVIAAQDSTFPYLVYLEDKALIFDERREAFIMYGVQGRTWVALGDPVGPPERVPELIRLFIARCDDYGGTPVFYEVGTKYLHHYADFGLTFVKVGEEARVDLRRFTLDGPRGARFRQLVRRLEKDGGIFRVLPTDEVRRRMEELRAVSDDWLRSRSVAEKGFSLGCFDPQYVARFPAAIVECGRRIQAFATLWPGLLGQEVSADLMRHHHDAPRSVMEALFTHLMIWGREEGYRWFVIGMAPMSGFEQSPVAPLWSRAGRLLYEHGTPLYNFQGLRAFKSKFDPVWESRYLVYPGGLALLRIAADVSALVSGGYRRIFYK